MIKFHALTLFDSLKANDNKENYFLVWAVA